VKRRMIRGMVPVVGALVLAFGLVSSASAATQPPARLAEPLTLEASPNAGIGWAVLEQILASGILPEPARIAIARAAGEQLELRSPGFACRRVIDNADAPAEIVERCREALANDDSTATRPSAGELCRRIAANPGDAPGELIQRCREWVAGDAPTGMAPEQACRRVAAASDGANVDDLIARCRVWLQSQDDGSNGAIAACRRLSEASVIAPTLAERCRELLSDDGERTGGRPEVEREQVRPSAQRARTPERSAASSVERSVR
jgi:hypothetical protein